MLIVLLLFAYRFGYRLLATKFPKIELENFWKHAEIIWFMIEDIQSFLMTVVIVVTLFNVRELFKYR